MNTNDAGQAKIRLTLNTFLNHAQQFQHPITPEKEPNPEKADSFTPSSSSASLFSDTPITNSNSFDANPIISAQVDFDAQVDRFLDGVGKDIPDSEVPLEKSKSKKADNNNPNVITIIHTNDIHGKLTPSKGRGGMVNLSGAINKLKEENPHHILVDVGDVAYNYPISDKYRFDPFPELMNEIGYDAFGPGNHEYQWEADKYGGVFGNPDPTRTDNLKELSEALNFPVVNCNTVLKKDGKRPDFLKSFIIKDINGVKVGITGVCTQRMATSAHPLVADNWKVLDPSQSLRETIPEMEKAGADIIVVLSHEGIGRNQSMIQRTPGIDLMIGAHDHQLTKTPIYVKDPDGRQVPLVEAFSHGKNVGELDLTIDTKSKEISRLELTMHDVTSSDQKHADPDVVKIVDEWSDKLKRSTSDRDDHDRGTTTQKKKSKDSHNYKVRDGNTSHRTGKKNKSKKR